VEDNCSERWAKGGCEKIYLITILVDIFYFSIQNA